MSKIPEKYKLSPKARMIPKEQRRQHPPEAFEDRNRCVKKYEIYLPLKYNDGEEVEPEKLKRVREELIAMFGALTVSALSAPFQGTWQYGGVEFIDHIIKIEVITAEDLKAHRFFKKYKGRLKERHSSGRSAFETAGAPLLSAGLP